MEKSAAADAYLALSTRLIELELVVAKLVGELPPDRASALIMHVQQVTPAAQPSAFMELAAATIRHE